MSEILQALKSESRRSEVPVTGTTSALRIIECALHMASHLRYRRTVRATTTAQLMESQNITVRGRESHEYMWQAKSVCRPSSREMSSLEKVRPGMRPRFLSQKMAQKLPLKNIPSTHANATKRCAKLLSLLIADASEYRGTSNARQPLNTGKVPQVPRKW